jgi:hypothetical protein
MKSNQDALYLEKQLNDLIVLLIQGIGSNPYEDIEKAKKIVIQRNFKQFKSIEKKLKELTISLYNRRLSNIEAISKKIEHISALLKEFE